MKNIGRNETITVKVASIVGGLISSTAKRAENLGGNLRSLKWRKMF